MARGVKLDPWPKITLLYMKHTAVLWFDFVDYAFVYSRLRIIIHCKDINEKLLEIFLCND